MRNQERLNVEIVEAIEGGIATNQIPDEIISKTI